MDSLKLNPVQKAAFSLIQQDLRYIYTVIKNINPKASNYIPSMLPYLGVVIDGAEDWLKAIKNSSKCKFCMPLMNHKLFFMNKSEIALRCGSRIITKYIFR